MKLKFPILAPFVSLLLLNPASSETVEITNPSVEVNSGVSPSFIAGAGVPGWEGIGQVIKDRTDYGNGGWRLSFEDSASVHQMTGHVIQSGSAYSLRFDAAMFSGTIPGNNFTPNLTLVGTGVRNGNFNDDTSSTDSRSFNDTPFWTNLGSGAATLEATRTTLAFDNSRNAVISQNGTKKFGVDTGHTLTTGEVFQASFVWRDASSWNDASDRIAVTLFTTSDDTISGPFTLIQTLISNTSTQNSTYESATLTFAAIPASANGKRLFCHFEGIDGNGSTGGFARLDNFTLQRGTVSGNPNTRQVIADLYVDNGGSPQVIATRSYPFKTPSVAVWDHYHMAVPAGSLDAHVGKTLGIRFRSSPTSNSNFQSVDNIRLDHWAANSPDGSFANDWNIPNRTWPGAGYWGNRLQDWQVAGSRVECILGTRDRRTLHRVGTTLRGNGAGFSLSVTTGLRSGTASSTSRSGFLINAGPGLDWRGALLVHDGLGRDFGIICGIRGDGAVLIEDYSKGSSNLLSVGAVPASFNGEAKLELNAIYNQSSGEYTLNLTAKDNSNNLLSSASAVVASDRVLGSFGLLSHRGSSSATYWFDDFSGTGGELNPEPERHLAILGAMYTLSRDTLQLTAQLSPINPTTTPPVTLETWDGSTWNQIATAAIDNTDNLSSFTGHFKIPNWNESQDTDFRLGVVVDGQTHYWTGTIRKDPEEKARITVAVTTCQRISDGNIQNNGFDWSPVRVWQPHGQLFTHIEKHQPDLLLALGDQIYEGQPTPEDSNDQFIRHHDYLYKWYLWVLQARELTRTIPTICIPDDHDVFQGNLWGEGGISTTNQNTGGYEEPASWVKMVERTQTLHLPDTDHYHSTQPAPPVAQGIPTYYTGMVYGGVGFAILEDRKFKTGRQSPPSDPAQQFLLGTRQKEFLARWNDDWDGQQLKCVVSQSPFGNLHTHSGPGYGFNLNDKDTHGWPLHRRNEAWQLLRKTRMFQIAGDQHLTTVAHHGINAPADAGYTFTAPAVANFFPRCWDPVHNSGGTTNTISPYKGDFLFDGNGTLPSGEPNLTAEDPAHMRVIAAGNPLQYHNQTRGINPANLHDRGAGYGIVHLDKNTRLITFEAWPIHADPEFPSTGSQFPDWPVVIRQTDNDGRTPTGFLPTIDTHWRHNSVIRIYEETSGDLVYAYRMLGNLFRPPAYDNTKTYRVEISHGDDPVSETRSSQNATPFGSPAIHRFAAVHPSIIQGSIATLQWNVESPSTLTIDNGLGDVTNLTINGVGQTNVSPSTDTTYTLSLNGSITAQTRVRVYPNHTDWLNTHFTAAEQNNPNLSGNDKDPDNDGINNWTEFLFQTNPRAHTDLKMKSSIVEENGQKFIEFIVPTPVIHTDCSPRIEVSADLTNWVELPSNSFRELSRDHTAFPTTSLRLRLNNALPDPLPKNFYRAIWK